MSTRLDRLWTEPTGQTDRTARTAAIGRTTGEG